MKSYKPEHRLAAIHARKGNWLPAAELWRDDVAAFETGNSEDDELRDYDTFSSAEEVAKVAASMESHYANDDADVEEKIDAAKLQVYDAVRSIAAKERERHVEEIRIADDAKHAAIMTRMDETEKAIEAALGKRFRPGNGWGGRSGYSRYGTFHLGNDSVSIRISDHEQKPGGGWSDERQDRYGESDVSYVVDEDTDPPSTEQIKRDAIEAIRAKR